MMKMLRIWIRKINRFGSKKTNNTDKKFSNKKRARPDKKKGKLNMEYEYEDKHKETETNYNNDW